MDSRSRAILLGCAIGDGYLNIRNRLNRGKYHYVSSELRVVHNRNQIDYCNYKAELVRSILGGKFSVKEFVHSPPSLNGREFLMCGFTCSNGYWKTLRNALYVDRAKFLSDQILSWMDVHTLSLMYMDDGHLRFHRNEEGRITSFCCDIATMCTKGEAERLVIRIEELTGCLFKIRFDKRCKESAAYFLQANTKEAKKFLRAIFPFAHPSLFYKFAAIIESNSTNAEHPLEDEDIV